MSPSLNYFVIVISIIGVMTHFSTEHGATDQGLNSELERPFSFLIFLPLYP